MSDQRCSDSDQSKRDIPSFIEPRPPLISNPFMRPRPQKGTNLLELFEEDSEGEEPEWLQVYLRLKPCIERKNLYEVKSDRCLITSVDTAPAGHGRRTQANVCKMYTFSHIFGTESNQKEIFENVVKENLKKLPEGHNFTLLTYGASGSGKTYTLMGTVASPGLVPRALEYVFRVVDAAQQPLYKPADGGANKLGYAEQDYELQWVKRLRHISAPLREKYRRMSVQLRSDLTASNLDLSNRTRYYIWVSFVEIYNEGIYDLLTNSDRNRATSKLRIREDVNGNVYVKGATHAFVRTGEEAYDVMVAGKHNLQVAATGVHSHSSRSHCIFTITMLTETEGGVRTSCVRLCDLAGCERARQTRNTGARMQESRAINSSLHVLERCLHMLRRKQRQRVDSTLVPYRESKLTRLLGAGLSGAKGEAVSMVVTLNPASEYAHETKHVLQLAAVAKDIQVNHTMVESSFESTATDTTYDSGLEVMRLRADNERLHFELVQAQSRNKELRASMEEKQQKMSKTMTEIAEEAKDMMRQYYEAQLQALRTEMDEMQEEYEDKLKTAAWSADIRRISSEPGTPSRYLQKKVSQLMTEIAILEEKLTAERLARARAEEEVQHLRACIDERDEKAEGNVENNDEVILTDSEGDEDDSCNESLEPTFKKEDINRSRLLQQSLINETINKSHNNTTVNLDSDYNDTIQDNQVNDSVIEKLSETLVDDGRDDTAKDSVYLTGESASSEKFGETNDSLNTNHNETANLINDHSTTQNNFRGTHHNETTDLSVTENTSIGGGCFVKYSKENVSDKPVKAFARGTYFVRCSEISDKTDTSNESIKGHSVDNNNTFNSIVAMGVEKIREPVKKNISHNCLKSPNPSDVSLAQFELLEIAATEDDSQMKETELFSNIKILKEKRIFFEDNKKEVDCLEKGNNEKKIYFDNLDATSQVDKRTNDHVAKLLEYNDDRSPSIVKDDVTNDFEPNKVKKLFGESFSRQPDLVSPARKPVVLPKKCASVDIFDGFDSPLIIKAKENNDYPELPAKTLGGIETTEPKSSNEKLSELTTEGDLFNLKPISVHIEKLDIASFKDKPKIETVSNGTGRSKDKRGTEVIEKSIIDLNISEPPKKSIEKISDDQKVNVKPLKVERPLIDHSLTVIPVPDDDSQSETQINSKENNTMEDFENIYKDITAPRATEFELLISQELSSTKIHENIDLANTEKTKYNLRHKINLSIEDEEKHKTAEVILESQAKCSSKPSKKNLRLRKRKNQPEDGVEDKEISKLKDIVNLQKEFSDVTLDVPADKKVVKDIPSPEKVSGGEENQPPINEMQSCPSKSITRSRRKLFTPRAEPLEESLGATGDSNERVRVPRPSYHRAARVRRKL